MFSFSRIVSEDGTVVENTVTGDNTGMVIMAGHISGGVTFNTNTSKAARNDDSGVWINGVKVA